MNHLRVQWPRQAKQPHRKRLHWIGERFFRRNLTNGKEDQRDGRGE